MEPEDVVYLLHNKELPTPEQSSAFKQDLLSEHHSGDFDPIFSALPRDGHPMDWLAIGIQTLGMWDCKNDWREDALNLVARMPRMMGLLFRYREGRTDDIPRTIPVCQWSSDLRTPCNSMLTKRSWHVFSPSTLFSTWITVVATSRHSWEGCRKRTCDIVLCYGELNERPQRPTPWSSQSIMLGIRSTCRNIRSSEVEQFVRGELAAGRQSSVWSRSLRAEDPRATVQFASARRFVR